MFLRLNLFYQYELCGFSSYYRYPLHITYLLPLSSREALHLIDQARIEELVELRQ